MTPLELPDLVPRRVDDVGLTEPACGVCRCTEEVACPGGCTWASLDPPLCTACAGIYDDFDVVHLEEAP